jgi:Ca-activated chloride channel family protein
MTFAQPQFLWALLAAIPAAAGLFYWSWRVKQKLIRRFVGARLLDNLTIGNTPGRQFVRMALLAAALAGLLLALARPQGGYLWEESHQRGLDIIVAIDTSRSMLAQDVAPNRLERAKLTAFDLMRQAKNDRLGLVVFAGNAFLQTPLTLDDQAFRQGLDAVNVGIIPRGGTALSAAIRTSLESFEKNSDNHKVLVLFTDGEDHDADTDTLAAAKEAAQAGMHIFTVGVGTPAGELLQVRDDQGNNAYVKDEEGNVVKSRLNETLLKQIANEANGFYLRLNGADLMQALYSRGLAPLPKTESASRLTKTYRERYHWFLLIALACLIIEYILPESPRRPHHPENGSATKKSALQNATVLLCFLFVALNGRASPSSAFREYQSGDYKAASDEYNRLSGLKTNDYRLHYDAGAAAYRAKQLEKAEQQFNATLEAPSVTPDPTTQERTYYNLGNTEYHLGESQSDPDKKQERWQQAIDSYVKALSLSTNGLHTNDLDAKNNLAFVQRKIEELKQQQQQQQKKQNKNQQDQNQGQSAKQDQKKDQDKKKQEQQQQQASQNEKKDKSQEEEQQTATPGQMSPQEARQMLAAQKDDEKTLIFTPEKKSVPPQPGKIKDW